MNFTLYVLPKDIGLTTLFLNNHNEFKCSNVRMLDLFGLKIMFQWNEFLLLLELHIGVYYKGQSVDQLIKKIDFNMAINFHFEWKYWMTSHTNWIEEKHGANWWKMFVNMVLEQKKHLWKNANSKLHNSMPFYLGMANKF